MTIATVATFALVATGCGQKKVLLEDDVIQAELQERGVDKLGIADFNQIRLIIERGEDATAEALLNNMPGRLRESPPWYYWKAVLATRDQNYAEAYRLIQDAKIGSGWIREHAYLAAWLELAEGNPLAAGEICLDILDRYGEDQLAWVYLMEAIAWAPQTEGVNAAVNMLNQRYPSARETRALMAIILTARGETSTGRAWMLDLIERHPKDIKFRLVYLNYLRGAGQWKEFGQHARQLLKQLPEGSLAHEELKDELESLVLAARQREQDPVVASIKLHGGGTDAEELRSRLPAGVPSNDTDQRDSMPPDVLDDRGEPLYYLPIRANDLVWVGTRRDRDVLARTPEMEDPERDNRARHAIDFVVPEGTPILAARGGVVTRVMAHQVVSGESEFERVIEIGHRDGTRARYWHIGRFKALVQPGEKVFRGQVIGNSGTSGRSRHPHLRFEVVTTADTDYDWWEPYTGWATLPAKFADVAEPDGYVVEGRWYRSRNVFVPPIY